MEGELLKLISDRAISAEMHGRAMGPEGSIAKLLWSEAEQHITEVASDVLGPDALGRSVGARPRLQPGAHDRGRHDASEQEHRRPKDSRASASVSERSPAIRGGGRGEVLGNSGPTRN